MPRNVAIAPAAGFATASVTTLASIASLTIRNISDTSADRGNDRDLVSIRQAMPALDVLLVDGEAQRIAHLAQRRVPFRQGGPQRRNRGPGRHLDLVLRAPEAFAHRREVENPQLHLSLRGGRGCGRARAGSAWSSPARRQRSSPAPRTPPA